jgi:hypothetical protein
MMAQPLPAGVVVKPVPAGGCEVNVQMTPVVAFLASLGSVAVHLIKLKFNSLEILESTLEEHAVLREELASTTNIVRRDEIDDYFSEENEKHHAMLAFKDKFTGKTKCDMWQASTFHDEYFKTKRGHLRYWFVCMAGGKEGPCMTVILSKKWDRKFADPGASKNWYKCTFCNANYKTGWGVFVEITFDGKIYCYRSTVPDEDTLDIKAMDRERKHKDASTAQALDDAIPMIAPTETLYVRCIDVEKGQYRLISKSIYMELPVWRWSDILMFHPVLMEVAK